MILYDEQLEELLLQKSYADLQPEERYRVNELLGGEEAYASARLLRMRSREVLQNEFVPADPGGLAAVMARTQGNRPRKIPLWQAVAAVLLAVAGTWAVMGMVQDNSSIDRLLAQSDTILQEIRVVDTVYLPAPQAESHPLTQAFPNSSKVEFRGKPLELTPQTAEKLAQAVASLPNPESMRKSGGVGAGPKFRPVVVAAISDGLLSAN